MNGLMLFGLGIVGIVSVLSSLALLQLGIIIDRYPTGGEEVRERSLSSPIESTRIFVGFFWLLFALGVYALLEGTTLMLIAGITTIFSVCMFILTALVFSFAVYSTMRQQHKIDRTIVAQVPAEPAIMDTHAPASKKHDLPLPGHIRRYPTGNLLVDKLLRRD